MSWRMVAIVGIARLTDVGFSPDSRHLLVLGRHGRTLIDVQTGVRSARDHDERTVWFDHASRHALGIGPFERVWIPMGGDGGGILPLSTADGWHVTARPDGADLRRDGEVVELTDAPDARAFGFAPDGRTFVLACMSGVLILRRGPSPRTRAVRDRTLTLPTA